MVTITCVYCAMEYPAGTPASGAPILTDHIKVCPKHPMREAESRISLLRSALVGLVGESDPVKLQAMIPMMAHTGAPPDEVAITVNAINALLATA